MTKEHSVADYGVRRAWVEDRGRKPESVSSTREANDAGSPGIDGIVSRNSTNDR